MLRVQIEALRHECEDRVEKVRKKWERDWAIERGEMGVVVEDGEETGEEEEEDDVIVQHREDADCNMVVDEDYAPTETTDDDKDRQWQWPSRYVPSLHPALKLIPHHPSDLAPYHCGRSSHLT
jgi:hypothetical protein